MSIHEKYMNIALDMAKASVGQTSPNPVVGAVVVKDHQIVGIGSHLKAGEAHAEVHALSMAKEKAKGATLYLTLEPCSHHGRTPPCADAVINSGIQRAFIATLDPNPLVAGRGVEKLKEAGIEVHVGLFESEATRINEMFNHYIVNKSPFITLKTATTLDGKIATVTGESQWITSDKARKDVHRLRHEHDAILVGINTVIEDNPRLTTRLEEEQGNHPIRVVLDSHLRMPLQSNLLDISVAPTWIFTSKNIDLEKKSVLESHGVKVLPTTGDQRVDIKEMLEILGENQVASLFVEGGGSVNAAFLEQRLVHKVVSYLAPKLIGGHQAPTAFKGEGFQQLNEAIHLQDITYEQVGADLKVTGYIHSRTR